MGWGSVLYVPVLLTRVKQPPCICSKDEPLIKERLKPSPFPQQPTVPYGLERTS